MVSSTLHDKLSKQHVFDMKVDEEKPSKSDINFIILDYLMSEGYSVAAARFAKEANLEPCLDTHEIQQRVVVRDAIHSGDIQLAIERINEINPEILDTDHELHFSLLRLQLIELIRSTVNTTSLPSAEAFSPALEFATSQLAPRAPTSPLFLQELERTMALLIFPSEKLTPQLSSLLDLGLRQTVANTVNASILASQGERRESRLRGLVRLRAWAEYKAREAHVELPESLELDGPQVKGGQLEDAMIT